MTASPRASGTEKIDVRLEGIFENGLENQS